MERIDCFTGAGYPFPMTVSLLYQILADTIVVIHLAFIIFVMLGGILAVFFPRVIWLHLPCVIWGVAVELIGFICPLTPLENIFRSRAGLEGYRGDFIIHCLEPVIYPEGLTRQIQMILAALVVLVNMCVYGLMVLRTRSGRH